MKISSHVSDEINVYEHCSTRLEQFIMYQNATVSLSKSVSKYFVQVAFREVNPQANQSGSKSY